MTAEMSLLRRWGGDFANASRFGDVAAGRTSSTCYRHCVVSGGPIKLYRKVLDQGLSLFVTFFSLGVRSGPDSQFSRHLRSRRVVRSEEYGIGDFAPKDFPCVPKVRKDVGDAVTSVTRQNYFFVVVVSSVWSTGSVQCPFNFRRLTR